MKTLETRIINWVESKLYPPQPKPQPRENVVTDYLAMRYSRILRLRELARKEASENAKAGHPYNCYKLHQADYLLKTITDRLNSRPFHHNFNMN